MSRFTTCGLTILLAFAPAALAVDGTVLINQSTITNGLPGCPTGGHLPIIICQSGSYRLSGNITVPDANTDAILITADNVTLDLNGFAIQGPATCTPGTFPVVCSTTGTGVGISSTNINIGVSNGAINGMGLAGIRFVGHGARLDSLRVANNAGVVNSLDPRLVAGGIIVQDAIVSNCTVTTNAQHGIFVVGSGTASLNTVSFNGGFGIGGRLSFNGIGALVASNNSVNGNGQDGMSGVMLAANNTLTNNIGFGFSCPVNFCTYQGNAFFGNHEGVAFASTSLGNNTCNGVVC